MQRIWQEVKSNRLRAMAVSLWLGILLSAQLIMTINDWTIVELADGLIRILRDTWYGPVIFVLCYIARPLVLIPGTIMTLMAGMVYGFWPGLFIAITANLVSATITYSITRWLFKPPQHFHRRLEGFVEFLRHNPFEAVLSLQLLYFSLDGTCSLAGFLRLPFQPFLLGIFIGGSVGTILGVILGSSIRGSIANGDLSIHPETLLLSVVILTISLGASAFLRRRHGGKI